MYNRIILLFFLSFSALAISFSAWSSDLENPAQLDKAVQSIKYFQGQHRILLIKQEVTCESQYADALITAKNAIDERQILWFLICNADVQTNYSGPLAESFLANTSKDYFVRDDVSIMLVGKDGGVKRRTDSLNLDELFALIDSMPMRQSEMNR